LSKEIVWNGVALRLPSNWEVTSEGGSKLNGVIVAAPEMGAKLEVYWTRIAKNPLKEHEKYVKKLVRKGFSGVFRREAYIAGHKAVLEYLKAGENKVFVTSWNCDASSRFFILQLDGVKVSQGLLYSIAQGVNCHPVRGNKLMWKFMGVGIELYEDYFIVHREFKLGYSMALFSSRDGKVYVVQYAVPEYVVESKPGIVSELHSRHLKLILHKFAKLQEISRNTHVEYAIVNAVFKWVKHGILLEKTLKCSEPKYIQTTLVKAPVKRLDEAREIAESVYCVEW